MEQDTLRKYAMNIIRNRVAKETKVIIEKRNNELSRQFLKINGSLARKHHKNFIKAI